MKDVQSNPANPRDSNTVSMWQENPVETGSSSTNHTGQTVYDALIVGGGITGLTAAILLQAAGKKCILAEAATIGYGTTGGTTAHLNTFFDATYADIEKDFGQGAAKLAAQSGKDAFALITGLVERLAIDCGPEHKEGYLFSANEIDEAYFQFHIWASPTCRPEPDCFK